MKTRTEKSWKVVYPNHPNEWGRVDKNNLTDMQKSHEL